MDKWQELKVISNREAQEIISNLLIEAGSQGVAIEDSADYLGQVGRYGEIFPNISQSDDVSITAYYPENIAIAEVKAELKNCLETLKKETIITGDFRFETKELAEEDWADQWKKYYEPTRITHDLTIVPSWADYQTSNNEKIIRLDPGMAFGTGTHPTTKMSLFALSQVIRGGETVIDVGTGSGVLSIASSLLGAKDIHAYDLDDVAVRVAKENIALNTNTANISVTTGDLLKGIEIKADVIVANILADILIHLTDDAYQLVKENGYLIMSGIISDKWEMVKTAAEKAGFFLETHMIQGEWHACVFKKTNDKTGVMGG
ncbi:50S ribosomal protein L11 methyltransferase [Streptococcus marimammalium]|uniref:50S ribosomal protein L11 methyltransferase n=1 Tax=Streptococcus marimammalium TaxID=269666 RepID=UPI000369799B|nr:50S ribosomal protein L11 methyltransferase [Streptococcus marimammalium]